MERYQERALDRERLAEEEARRAAEIRKEQESAKKRRVSKEEGWQEARGRASSRTRPTRARPRAGRNVGQPSSSTNLRREAAGARDGPRSCGTSSPAPGAGERRPLCSRTARRPPSCFARCSDALRARRKRKNSRAPRGARARGVPQVALAIPNRAVHLHRRLLRLEVRLHLGGGNEASAVKLTRGRNRDLNLLQDLGYFEFLIGFFVLRYKTLKIVNLYYKPQTQLLLNHLQS